MGLIRKTLSACTLGAIALQSDKKRASRSARLTKRAAKKQNRLIKKQNRLLKQQSRQRD